MTEEKVYTWGDLVADAFVTGTSTCVTMPKSDVDLKDARIADLEALVAKMEDCVGREAALASSLLRDLNEARAAIARRDALLQKAYNCLVAEEWSLCDEINAELARKP
jgi:hypothetical protein